MAKPRLSKKEYVRRFGSVCPYCESNDVNGRSLQRGGDMAWADAWCDSCEREWTDLFKLVGFEEAVIDARVRALGL